MTEILTERQAFLILNALPGTGSVVRNRLLASFGGDPRAVLGAGRGFLMAAGATPTAAAVIAAWRKTFDLKSEERRLADLNAQFLAPGDNDYPELLRQLADPPVGLYRMGRLSPVGPNIAIVGSRRATPYGLGVARALGAGLARAGVCVVSGLARGIDAAAHEGALSVGGRTAAVLGCGVDVSYPPEHWDLGRRIASAGALLSEFSLGRRPDRTSFVMRNRIISGMSSAVVVVESANDGGAMTTAHFAGEQGRALFAVPGRIDQPMSAGCHQLIRDGASLLTGVDDVLTELSHLPGFNSRTGLLPSIAGRDASPTRPRTARRPIPFGCQPRAVPTSNIIPEARACLGEDESAVLACFEGGAVLGADAVACKAGIPSQRVSAALMMLEIKRFLARGIDGAYEAQAQS